MKPPPRSSLCGLRLLGLRCKECFQGQMIAVPRVERFILSLEKDLCAGQGVERRYIDTVRGHEVGALTKGCSLRFLLCPPCFVDCAHFCTPLGRSANSAQRANGIFLTFAAAKFIREPSRLFYSLNVSEHCRGCAEPLSVRVLRQITRVKRPFVTNFAGSSYQQFQRIGRPRCERTQAIIDVVRAAYFDHRQVFCGDEIDERWSHALALTLGGSGPFSSARISNVIGRLLAFAVSTILAQCRGGIVSRSFMFQTAWVVIFKSAATAALPPRSSITLLMVIGASMPNQLHDTCNQST